MNTDGTNRVCTHIPRLDPLRGAGHQSVRGTDNLLLVQNFLDNSDGGLYTLNYDTFLNRQKIPKTIGRDLNPSWSNDGQTIAFAAYPTGRAEPYFFTNLFKGGPKNKFGKFLLTRCKVFIFFRANFWLGCPVFFSLSRFWSGILAF